MVIVFLTVCRTMMVQPLLDLERHGVLSNQQAEAVDDTRTLFLCVVTLTRCICSQRSKWLLHIKWPSGDKNRSYWSWFTKRIGQASRQRYLYMDACLLFIVLAKFLTFRWKWLSTLRLYRSVIIFGNAMDCSTIVEMEMECKLLTATVWGLAVWFTMQLGGRSPHGLHLWPSCM